MAPANPPTGPTSMRLDPLALLVNNQFLSNLKNYFKVFWEYCTSFMEIKNVIE